jgi:multisubunit Na+/H+ antiporter MnhG subunit
MSTTEVIVFYLTGFGTLAMVVGAFGLLDAYNGENRGARRVTWLIGLYTLGVLMDVAGLTVLGRWYFGMAMALMLVPVDTALRRHVVRRRRTAIGD